MVDLVAFGHIGDRGFLLLHDGLVHVGMPADRPKLLAQFGRRVAPQLIAGAEAV